MNPNEHFTVTKSLYSPKGIEQLCTIQIAKQIVKYTDINKLELPSTLKRNIKTIWKDSILYCDEQLPEDFKYENLDINNLSKTDVIAIMQCKEILPFVDEDENHISFEYYIYQDDIEDTHSKNICTRCTMDLNIHINRPDGWMHCSGKRLTMVTSFEIHGAESTMQEVIWNTDNWCDNCAIRPLFTFSFDHV